MELDDFTKRATAFLSDSLPRKEAAKAFVWGEGSDNMSMFEEKSREAEKEMVATEKAWRKKKYDAGFGWITGPTQYGGAGLTAAHERAYQAAEAGFKAPGQGIFTIGLGMVAPTILAHGSNEAKEKFLRAMYSADIVGCQLFSEPGAGSDLASLQTKAERDGDEWVITGQKVWTSGAHY
ncbi:MAG: acyl-CoA dehydrogenase family protein, partial [Actinomycetota bacterium]